MKILGFFVVWVGAFTAVMAAGGITTHHGMIAFAGVVLVCVGSIIQSVR